MAQEQNLTERAPIEPRPVGSTGMSGASQGLTPLGATPLMRGGENQLPQHRERHTIVEKKLVARESTNEVGRHLLAMTAAVNAYAVEKGSLILAIYGSQPGEGTSTVARELAISLSRSPTNSVLLIDGNTGNSNQSKYFGSNFVDRLWAAARG